MCMWVFLGGGFFGGIGCVLSNVNVILLWFVWIVCFVLFGL